MRWFHASTIRGRMLWASVLLATGALVLTGCGGGQAASTSAPVTAKPPGDHPLRDRPPARPLIYRLELSGHTGVTGPFGGPPGAPNGSGLATLSFITAKPGICWSFFQLKEVSAPTVARVYRSDAGSDSWMYGFALGHGYKAMGCIHKPLYVLRLIESEPQGWYLSIHTARYPGGAVRAQL